MKPYGLSIHIFRRDLRLEDNTALMAALTQSELVVPVFIFDNRQSGHQYRGNNSFEFMVNSLVVLNQKLNERGARLFCFKGDLPEILVELLNKTKAEAVFFNRDYTPFSRQRDNEIEQVCRSQNIEINIYADALLNEPETVSKPDGNPYSVFTAFFKKARINAVSEPAHNIYTNYYTDNVDMDPVMVNPADELQHSNPNLLLKGGRKEGLRMVDQLADLHDYLGSRNFPAVKGTSLLSAHHKFGTVSIRETYQKIATFFGTDHSLIAELYWRDFFTHIVWHFPYVLGQPFKEKYKNLQWENDEAKFEAWCEGRTGFPMVDAGIRELITTGYMHNRVRMVTASFLVKNLHIDWQWGERFFAGHLIDYDPAVNNGNWQWAASTGCDAQPYFRIFNPWNQQAKFDPQCTYIKKWLPELNGLKSTEIHKIETFDYSNGKYPRPIVNHKESAEYAKQMFR